MVHEITHRKSLSLIAGLLAVCLSLTSCESLRKKFTRHPKNVPTEDQAIVPVLQPQEYPSPLFNPEHNYREHYDLIKAFYNDLWTNLEDKTASAKYSQYAIRQVSAHITEMQKLVDADTQTNLIKLNHFLDYYTTSLGEPEAMRNRSRIESDLRAFDRFLREHLRADRIKGRFVKAM